MEQAYSFRAHTRHDLGASRRSSSSGSELENERMSSAQIRRQAAESVLETEQPLIVSDEGLFIGMYRDAYVFGRPCSDLLSRVLRLSTIGAEEFDGRVRDGIGSWAPRKNHKVSEKHKA